MIEFFVEGKPAPKQSFRFKKGGGYQTARVKSWQAKVAYAAKEVYQGDPLEGPISVKIDFYLPDRRRRDWDNLAKGVMDGLEGVLFKDDNQVIQACVRKIYDQHKCGAGVFVRKA